MGVQVQQDVSGRCKNASPQCPSTACKTLLKPAEAGALARSKTNHSADNRNRKQERKGSFTLGQNGKLIWIVTRQTHIRTGDHLL